MLSTCLRLTARRPRDLRRFSHRARHLRKQGETIYALSSGRGKCGIAVFRVSGDFAGDAVKALADTTRLPSPRRAHLRRFYDPSSREPIDEGLLLWFPGTNSFTGEDLAEFHVHGGPAIVAAILNAFSNIPGIRQAEAGEFAKRAFLHGKLDLTEVEGLSDLINAETEAQRRQAFRQMGGELSKLYKHWKKTILKCLANMEAYIDFSEDDNIEDNVLEHVDVSIKQILQEIKEHLDDNRRGELLRSGVSVAIIGQPNVGKSSLLNAICQRPAAIVSHIAGTTRDIIEMTFNIGGYPVMFSDTAGLRVTDDVVEKEGVRRALLKAVEADIKVIVLEAPCHCMNRQDVDFVQYIQEHFWELFKNFRSSDVDGHQTTAFAGNSADKEFAEKTATQLKSVELPENTSRFVGGLDPQDMIVVFNKSDVLDRSALSEWESRMLQNDIPHCTVSCVTNSGLKNFLEILTEKIKEKCGNPLVGTPSLTQVRHRSHLVRCVKYLDQYDYYIRNDDDVVLAAENVRKALRELGKITGKVTTEDILDVIFKDFCIGK